MQNTYCEYITVNDFLHHMESIGKSKNTLVTYRSALVNLFKKTETDPWSISSKKINSYLKDQIKNKKPTSVRVVMVAIRTFFEFMGKEVNIEVECPRVIHKAYKIPTVNQVYSVIEKAKEEEIPFLGVRNSTIIAMLYYTGIRIDELHRMMVSDVFLQEKSIIIRSSKNKTARRIPISSTLLPMLESYIEQRNALSPKEGNLFISYGKNYRLKKMSYGNTRHVVKDCFVAAGFGEFSPYCLRHLFATVLIQKGTPVGDVAKLMGHKNVKSLLDYICSTELTKENCVDVL